MKEIIENIQILFDNKEFTLVDELLKGQGLDYDVLNCSRLFTLDHDTLNCEISYSVKIILTKDEYDGSKINVFRFVRNNSMPNFKEHFVELLDWLNLSHLISNYIFEDCITTKHLELSNSEAIEFILKLNNYKQCGTK